MSVYSLREMPLEQLDEIYAHAKADFPVSERPPKWLLAKQIKKGSSVVLIFVADGVDSGYAQCVKTPAGYVLVYLFAVFSHVRASGLGSQFMRLLFERYGHTKGVVVEVEAPDHVQGSDKSRRIVFYQRLGFVFLPGISHCVCDTPLDLMVMPFDGDVSAAQAVMVKDMLDTYGMLMGVRTAKKLVKTYYLEEK